MFAAHLAAGLAIKSAQPKAPTWALLTGAFLPDFFWIAFAAVELEPATDTVFFDGWSHSLFSILLQATLFALLFYRERGATMAAVWIAVFSHFCLDVPIHPRPIELYPHSLIHAPWDLWKWGSENLMLSESHYWWIQLGLVVVLLGIYVANRRKLAIAPNLVAASCALTLGLHFLF